MAYRLKLPPGSLIFPIFHIALLKPFQGKQPGDLISPLSPLNKESHPVVCLDKIVAYRSIKRRGKAINQVLIEWAGLPPDDRSWEDLEDIKRLTADSNLEDKIKSDGGRDVTITLDLHTVVARLQEELEMTEEEFGESEETRCSPTKTRAATSARPVRTRRGTRSNDFDYS